MTYAPDHKGALADVAASGAAVTFTRRNPGTHNPLTETFTTSGTTSVAGRAIKTRSNPRQYEALKLVQTEALTLFFVPTTYGDMPTPGMQCTWAGQTHTVRDVDPVAPDGTVIAARVVVSK